MDESASHPHAPGKPGPKSEPPSLAVAMDAVIGELERTVAAERAAADALEAARRWRAEASAAAGRILRLLPPAARNSAKGRIAWAEGRICTPKERLLPRGARARAIRQFLIERHRDDFRVVELAAWLEAEGFALAPGHAANACRTLCKQGLVTRTAYGQYTINRWNPLLDRATIAAIREELDT